MTEFNTPTDIGNRALQHCGAEMMDATLGFTEPTKNARQVSFAYGKLRRAELRRNIWRFATRRAVLRAVDVNTLLLAPSLWASTTTYFVGSIVSDESSNLWICRTPDNLNNEPQNSTTWEPYFGPLSVMLYDGTTAYLAGELVYTAAGDGTYNTYISLSNSNALHPALPNQWSTLATYFKDQVVQGFPAWAIGTNYTQGQTVTYTDDLIYSSLINGNLGNAPSTNPTRWAVVPTLTLTGPGPTSSPVSEWVQDTTYSSGWFVMFNGIEYVSIANSNTGNFPNATASTFWKPLTLGTFYMSLIDLNIGNDPANAPALWDSGTSYNASDLVGGSDGLIYSSIAGANLGNDPITDGGANWTDTGVLNPWTTVFTQGGGNQQWRQIGGASFPFGIALSELNFTYPIGTGPITQAYTRNVYMLPAGFLRQAPQDPRAGSLSYLGSPTNLDYLDWVLEDDLIVSSEAGPILLRFVADLNDVRRMDDMFCEGLAARIALEVCEPLTQSSTKLQTIGSIYQSVMFQARAVNAIEVRAEEPALDDYIACRA